MTTHELPQRGTESTAINVAKAKGRPMLSWVGKRPLREVRAFPSQLIERFEPETPDGIVAPEVDWSEWPERFDRGGLLLHGDNKEVLAHLLATGFRGKVDLIYIDPPFDSGADYVRKVQLRGASGSARLDGETYTLGEQIQYTDIWANDTYLQFMYERLLLIKELLGVDSNVVLHTDYHRTHQLRMLMDEVFGSEAFVNELIWHYPDNFQGNVRGFASNHDVLLWYGLGRYPWNRPERELEKRVRRPTRVWDSANNRLVINRDENGKPLYRDYTEASFDDVIQIAQRSVVVPGNADYTGFPTAKPPALLSLLVAALSNPGDVVLDCFIGSGTTAAVAQKLGRRWIGADINKGAIQTTEKRLAAIVHEQIAAGGGQLTLNADADTPPRPAQTLFTVRRVNDYDLQIQHNEARELAIEHLGVQRTRVDTFFHGTLGRELVHIVGFDHPTTVLDLRAVVDEIEARTGEERDVVVVGLGREPSTVAWLETHNRHRPVNNIRVIDLRTDPKHGRFFEHAPASARVTFERKDGRLRVRIDDAISPSILERLAGQEGVLAPHIDDWRSMVDSVAVDTAFDGQVFDVDLIDIPERRADLVDGIYELDAPLGDRPAAVRITDMLGEEILVVESRG